MFIFDSHLHFFSYDFFAALVRQKDAHAEVDRVLAELAARAQIALPDHEVEKHLQRWLRELDHHSVDRAVVIASLPEGYRMVFVLHHIEGYGHQEIGDMLNISEGTSKSQLHKARKELKKMLEPYLALDGVL